MRSILRFGKRGGIETSLVDIYSVFFYIFILVVFTMLFSLNRCFLNLFCDQGDRYTISAELDRGLEARLLLLDILRSPVAMPGGGTLTVSELLVLHEAGAADYTAVIDGAVRARIESYLGQGLDDDESADLISRSWGMRITYRGTPGLEMGTLASSIGQAYTPRFYRGPPPNDGTCPVKVPASAVVPLVYNPGNESQVAEVGLVVCDELLGSGGGDL